MEISDFNIWIYLAQVAPVVLVMAIAIYKLWKQYIISEEKREQTALDNLETLNNLIKVLADFESNFKDANRHVSDELRKRVEELKDHITNRVDKIKDRSTRETG